MALLLATALGVALALSFYFQVRLQGQAMSGATGAKLFTRIAMAGLSFAILAAGVLVGKSSAVSYEAFMLLMFVSAAVAFIARWRSGSMPHPDAPQAKTSIASRRRL